MTRAREESRGGGTALQEQAGSTEARTGKGNGSTRTEGRRSAARLPALWSGSPASPWELVRRMSDEMNQLFESLGGTGTAAGRQPGASELGIAPPTLVPHIEVEQRENDMVVRADLPGLTTEDVNVTVDNGVLTISGERRQENREERGGVVRSEVIYGTFYRTIPLPNGADENRVSATFRNGVLEITIPLSEREQGRRVQVQS